MNTGRTGRIRPSSEARRELKKLVLDRAYHGEIRGIKRMVKQKHHEQEHNSAHTKRADTCQKNKSIKQKQLKQGHNSTTQHELTLANGTFVRNGNIKITT